MPQVKILTVWRRLNTYKSNVPCPSLSLSSPSKPCLLDLDVRLLLVLLVLLQLLPVLLVHLPEGLVLVDVDVYADVDVDVDGRTTCRIL